MQTLNCDGVKLAYREAGRGAPPLLLVHGFCGNHTHLAPQFDYFRGNHRVVAVDRRGHGHSDKPNQAYTIEGFADDLAWLCHQLGLYKPVIVVHSMGVIGLDLAARFPELPAALVLLDAPFFPPPEVLTGFQQLLDGLRSPTYRAVLRQTVGNLIFVSTANQPRKADLIRAMVELPQQVIVSSWENFLTYNPELTVAECRVPLLHLSSAFPANLTRLRELCPQVVTGQTVGAGHFPQLEVPEQVNAMIDRFLALV
ncbi:MAG TPA: alpha/beta hydrolase [Anaerolineae bacterium]|nr:alpha/beta hydrolase [Anaerolineae bacterium]